MFISIVSLPLEKEMATHSSILAWEIPWTEKPGVGCYFLLQGIFLTPGWNPACPALALGFFPTKPPGKSRINEHSVVNQLYLNKICVKK